MFARRRSYSGLAALVVAGFMVVSCANDGVPESWDDQADDSGRGPVSYTHLTLPTILLV